MVVSDDDERGAVPARDLEDLVAGSPTAQTNSARTPARSTSLRAAPSMVTSFGGATAGIVGEERVVGAPEVLQAFRVERHLLDGDDDEFAVRARASSIARSSTCSAAFPPS